ARGRRGGRLRVEAGGPASREVLATLRVSLISPRWISSGLHMPVTYRIDSERRRILTRCSGETTLPEVLAHFDELERDPRVPEGADVLLDLMGMTSLPNVGQIRSAADRAGAAARKVRFGAIAIVSDGGDAAGMARAFGTLTARLFTRTGVFSSRIEAEAFLESASNSGERPGGAKKGKS